MYIDINIDKGKNVINEFNECSRDIEKAARILNEVHSSLGSCSGLAIPEVRKKIKKREAALNNRRVSVQSLADVLDKILSKYRKTEVSILFSEFHTLPKFNAFNTLLLKN